MRWQVETKQKVYTIAAVSSKDAVEKVKQKDNTDIVGVKLLPKNTVDKIRSSWRNWFGK